MERMQNGAKRKEVQRARMTITVDRHRDRLTERASGGPVREKRLVIRRDRFRGGTESFFVTRKRTDDLLAEFAEVPDLYPF